MPTGTDGSAPRKRRTRQHVIAAQSANHVERFIIDEGHTAEQRASDYGYDLVLFTYDATGFVEEGTVNIQLKASDKLVASGNDYVFDIDIRDHALWIAEPMPVILILFDASRRRAYWGYIQQYFTDPTRRPKTGAKTVRIRIPKRQTVNRSAIRRMREYKRRILEQFKGRIDHA